VIAFGGRTEINNGPLNSIFHSTGPLIHSEGKSKNKVGFFSSRGLGFHVDNKGRPWISSPQSSLSLSSYQD
jgi:hypothetical protein